MTTYNLGSNGPCLLVIAAAAWRVVWVAVDLHTVGVLR